MVDSIAGVKKGEESAFRFFSVYVAGVMADNIAAIWQVRGTIALALCFGISVSKTKLPRVILHFCRSFKGSITS